jgi:diacylglycerol kinase (ATP)
MKRVFIIINPASGRQEPILSYINTILQKTDIVWDVGITKQKHDAYRFAKKAIIARYDIISVYGGDGTVAEVAKALFKQEIPLHIIPGGTANVLAKEIGLPVDTQKSIMLLRKKSVKTKMIDGGLLYGQPFNVRIEVGLIAKMVKSTSRKSKDQFGMLAYSIHAIKHITRQKVLQFSMEIDGKKVQESGVALMVANVGNIGVTGFSVLPNMKIDDGLLDVVLFKNATVHSLFVWLRSVITGKRPFGTVKHWKAKHVLIAITPEQTIICDDALQKRKKIKAEIVPAALRVVVG